MSGSHRPVVGSAEADEHYRTRALEQLWKLRDAELMRAGHSTPEYIAARVTNDLGYPKPPPPPLKHLLDDESAVLGDAAVPPLASWCEPDRQIVTGVHREHLLQWLPQVVGWMTTPRQLEVLDGFTARTSLAYVRELLASEGFDEVRDVFGNAGPAPAPRELYDYHPVQDQARRDAATEPQDWTSTRVTGRVALVLCSRVDGFLATVHAVEIGNAGLSVQTVAVYYNVMVLDRELSWAGVAGSRYLAWDAHGARTTIHVGNIGNMPVYRSGGSLRVGLAALRAFGRPVAPWYESPLIGFGEDKSDVLGRVDEILAGLPVWVHELLGPQLTARSRSGDGSAA
ncbi:hypothetical protein [Micromonospora aurantiaca (nom. illeg.)]|uniref:hypothetical protein n=1 Tax=Micromonospora aurantiaca (nom. illeg.) TaxID=47850 RepID=UPI0033C64020